MLRWVWFKMTLLSKRRHYFANRSPYSPSYSFFSSHTWIWELDHKESWAPKNWCFWTVVLEKTLGSPLDCKELEPVHPKGDQSWMFIGRTDAETETPVLWSPDVKSRVTGKDGAAGETGGRRRKWWQDKMAGWQHGLSGHGFEQVLGDGEDREAWRAAVHGVSKSWTCLSDWTAASKGLPWRLSEWRVCNAGDVGLIPGLGRRPGEGTGTTPQCSCLGNPRNRGAWQATAHEVAKRQTRLSH